MKKPIEWSEIDQTRFYTIGTGVYSVLTAMLHPLSVVKIRQQSLHQSRSNASEMTKHAAHQSSSSFRNIIQSRAGVYGLFRGLPVVLTCAVPARAVYIGTLETSREYIAQLLKREKDHQSSILNTFYISDSIIASASSGLAGGIAAVSAQVLIVPMDVISQRQIVQCLDEEHAIGVRELVRDITRVEGLRGLYRGFALSLFGSLPGGAAWWATYGGCQHELHSLFDNAPSAANYPNLQWFSIHLFSCVSAAISSATLTQPLDVIKTRLQVASGTSSPSFEKIALDLIRENGNVMSNLYRGYLPRITHISLWGTVLSGAYEYLKYISRVEQPAASVGTHAAPVKGLMAA